MRKTRTSVIIPSYNEKFYLEKCLLALFKQEVPVQEIIVVDNNTADDSIDRARKKFPKVLFLEEKNQGIVFARNTGFDAASGDILVKLDADSIVTPSWHANLLETIGEFDGWSGHVASSELNPRFSATAIWVFNFIIFKTNKIVAGTPLLLGANMAITKGAWSEIRGDLIMRNDILEDTDMSIAMADKDLNITNSSYRGAMISARSGNTPLKLMYARTFGMTRVFWLRRKWFSAAKSVVNQHVTIVCWLILKPLALFGRKPNKRPRPEQY